MNNIIGMSHGEIVASRPRITGPVSEEIHWSWVDSLTKGQ